MSTIMTAARQFASRPNDQRFLSLHEMGAFLNYQTAHSKSAIVSSRALEFRPAANDEVRGIEVVGKAGVPYNPTHWSFGQLAQLAGAPAGYLRTLPAPLVADLMNYGMKHERDVADVQVLLRKNGTNELAAATGPNYGRVPNSDVVDALIRNFGNGVDDDWRVPGEFGKAVQVTKANTTFYASDRDVFVFLADEKNRINIDNRRDGKAGSLARGFFVWNSEVGASTFGVAMFLFDYVCCNRIVWGAQGYKEIRIRHTSSAPDRWLENCIPVIEDYAQASAKPIEDTLKAAQNAKVDNLADFLAKRRYTKGQIANIGKAFEADEGRPVETLWDVTTAITAYARGIEYQDERVEMERDAGRVLDLVAVR